MPTFIFIVANDIAASFWPDWRKKGQRQTLPFSQEIRPAVLVQKENLAET
jgi:hypothetical protein